MLAIKIYNGIENRTDLFNKTIKNIISYVHDKLYFKDVKIISDDGCIELVSGDEQPSDGNQIVAELLIRKTITINNDDFKDRDELDKFISQIKNFCDNAKLIENVKYYPVEIRKPKKD